MEGPNQKIFLTFLALSFLLAPPFLQVADSQLAWAKTGKVFGISGGDTISVMPEGKAVKVCLHGIDCPEKKQAFSTKAKQFPKIWLLAWKSRSISKLLLNYINKRKYLTA
jgi:endonuclease YncB( thermonuclease family)